MWEPIESALTSSSRPARISLSTTFRAASHPTPFYARSRRPEATAVPGFRGAQATSIYPCLGKMSGVRGKTNSLLARPPVPIEDGPPGRDSLFSEPAGTPQ